MQAVYHTSIDELTISFIENIKKQFQNAKVDIVIREQDETDYLNSSKINKQYLDDAILEVNNNKFINKSIKELDL